MSNTSKTVNLEVLLQKNTLIFVVFLNPITHVGKKLCSSVLQEVAGNEVSWTERSSAGCYTGWWAVLGAEEQTLGKILPNIPWSYSCCHHRWSWSMGDTWAFLSKTKMLLQNVISVMVELWWDMWITTFLFLAMIYNYWYWEHQGEGRVCAEGCIPGFWPWEHLLFERNSGSGSLKSWCL